MQKHASGLAIAGTFLSILSPLRADIVTQAEKVPSGFVNPSSRFHVHNGWNIFLDAEFLWWIAQEDGLFFAQKGVGSPTTANPPDGASNFSGYLEKVTPHWDAGARVTLGGNMLYDEWDILLTWTYFATDAKKKKEGNLLALWAQPDVAGANNVNTAKGKWTLTMDVFDVEMGRAFWVGKHFSLRPFFGLRGSWIDQSFKIGYSFSDIQTRLKAKSDFDGGGLRGGVDLRFALLGGWSIFGLGSYSLQYGHFDANFREKENSIRIAKSKNGSRSGLSTGQLALGVRWDTYFRRSRYHLGVYAAWEQNIWYGMNKMSHFMGQLNQGIFEQMNGDLTLQGGTFGVRFDF